MQSGVYVTWKSSPAGVKRWINHMADQQDGAASSFLHSGCRYLHAGNQATAWWQPTLTGSADWEKAIMRGRRYFALFTKTREFWKAKSGSREWRFSNIRTRTGSRTLEWRTNVWSCACWWRALWLQMKLLASALCTPQLFCADSVAVLNTSCLQSISCSVYTVQFSFQSNIKRFKLHPCNGLKFHSFSWPGIFCIRCL